ncbi:MAG TPA: ribonuclease H-like domain-containing protein, partial [Bryobacteraceae bacterium]|nr:ribonuclease H-like domain-containing protein [Bryobacteraceae bacterium]
MQDIQEQLALLRRRIARVDLKYANARSAAPLTPTPSPWMEYRPAKYHVEEWLSGSEVQTPHGSHFETERIWEAHRRHGSLDISTLSELPPDLLEALSGGTARNSPAAKWAFLDTETTGLAGGAGTYAFLIGVGRITPEGFRLKQFFMREPAEEASLLHALSEHLSEFDTLITYNGRTYDQPLLETRYRMARRRPPFASLEHLDLLFGARRLWKLRFDSCRLVDLENQILGVERQGDLPGDMIPYVYFEYLRTREVDRVAPILHHNALDILTLACLTAIVPWAFRDPENAPLSHGAEMVGLARWLAAAGQPEKAIVLYRRAINRNLRDDLLFRTMWDTARLEKKLRNEDA